MKKLVFMLWALTASCILAASAQVSYPDFASVAGLNLVGNAGQWASRLRVTPSSTGQRGAAWYSLKQPVANGFVSTFQFQLTRRDMYYGGSDGLAFVIQNHSAIALGYDGGWLGYTSIPNCLAIEFDTYLNADPGFGDPNANHVAVHSLGTLPNTSAAASLLATTTGTIPFMRNGDVHTAQLSYTGGTLSVYLDNMSIPVLALPLDLQALLNLDSGKAWVGFTAATGAGAQNHDILSWHYSGNPVPEPCSLVLALFGGIGGMGALRIRRQRSG